MKAHQIRKWLPATLIYIFLFLGGLWNLLGKFQQVMQWSAGSVLMILSAFAWLTTRYSIPVNREKRNFDLFSLFVIVVGILVESLGVQTGFPFGSYQYGKTLVPSIGTVPISIGFAWLGVLLSSAAISQRLLSLLGKQTPWALILLTATLMVAFDVVMEPAAIRLGYWNWDGCIPIQNYISWWVIGALFAGIGYAAGPLRKPVSILSIHIYFAQLIYFGMSLL